MQTSTEGSRERRKSASPRIPVDLLVELCVAEERRSSDANGAGSDRMLDSWSDVSEAFADSYDADGLDLSPTGLRLRSAVLPDVGQRLRCRFDLPETEARCEAEGEVVWSNDAGRHGEFGLRFEALSPDVETALARWVMDRGPTTLPGTEPAPGVPKAQLARVRLDGVSTALEAEISVRDELRLDVEQPLPFLELGRLATVDADGTTERRRLEHVSLRIENGVPRLILGLVAAPSSSAGMLAAPAPTPEAVAAIAAETEQARIIETRPAESTVQDEDLDTLLARSADAPAASTSSSGAWVTDDAPAASEEEELEAAPAKPITRGKQALFGPAEDSLEDEDPRLVARRRRKLDEVRRVLLDGEELPEAPPSSSGAEVAAAPLALDGMKQRARAVGAAIAPSMSRLTVALRTGWASFVAGIVPRSKQAYAAVAGWIARVASLLGEQLRTRAPKLGALLARGAVKEKRRTTAPPPASVQRDAAPRRVQRAPGTAAPASTEEVVTTRPRVPLRYVLAGVLALAAVGTLAYALGGGSSEPAPIELPIAPAPAAAATSPEPVTAPAPAPETSEAVEVAPAAAPAPPATPVPAAPVSEPSALAAASTDEGRLPMPGYPSIARSAESTTASAAPAPAAAAPVISSGRSFGAERVERGQTTTLRMSLAPSGLEGQADAHGFTVTIRGALSLDRAAAIARSNPAVDRASILNRGDHSVLDVRFVEGRSPAYRVELRGEQLDVTIGR